MARLTKVEKNDTTGDTRELLEGVAKLRGNVPNMFRVFAHRPEILNTMVAHLNAVTGTGTVPVKTKELVATLVSRLNHCEY
jgi:alkylhydroperoxidase family enzyme